MLEIRGLTKNYPSGTVALSDFSLSVGEGVLGLLGPNGAGKSTLMSILATVTKPTSGTFLWEGQDGVAQPLSVRRALGFLPQDFGVYEKLTAREFLLYLGRLKGLSGSDLKRRIGEILALVNLHGAADRRLGGYSGGMRQRVGIAQALLGDPKLLIVDEPTVGLDPEERVRFRNLLAEVAHGRVVILSTHIVSDVEAVASTIAVVRAGRLVVHETPEELLRTAEGKVFRAVVPSEKLAEVQARIPVSNLARRADGVHVRFVDAAGSAGHRAVLPDSEPVEPSLEDAYLLAQLGVVVSIAPQRLTCAEGARRSEEANETTTPLGGTP
jgi:ABC-type multidrug transport system ATPase subunit